MRMMLKVSIPTEFGNRALGDGILSKTVNEFVEQHRPEASYFATEAGNRCAFFFFDMKDSASLPVIAEPFFMRLNAEVTCTPCMNVQDLKTGVEQALKKR